MKEIYFEKSPVKNDEVFLVPLTDENSFGTILEIFNREIGKFDGILKIDMIINTGERVGRFVSANVNNGHVDIDSIKIIDYDELLDNFTRRVYSALPEGYLNKVYPVAFRNEIKNMKRQNSIDIIKCKELQKVSN